MASNKNNAKNTCNCEFQLGSLIVRRDDKKLFKDIFDKKQIQRWSLVSQDDLKKVVTAGNYFSQIVYLLLMLMDLT